MPTISQAKPHDIQDIKVFYSQCGYGGGLREEDLILIAQSEGKIVGAVRLCPDTGFLHRTQPKRSKHYVVKKVKNKTFFRN